MLAVKSVVPTGGEKGKGGIDRGGGIMKDEGCGTVFSFSARSKANPPGAFSSRRVVIGVVCTTTHRKATTRFDLTITHADKERS